MTKVDLKLYDRIAIIGRPGVGKSWLSFAIASYLNDSRKIVQTDDYLGHKFIDVPDVINTDLAGVSKFIIEGVQAMRCIKYGLPVDLVVYLDSKAPLKPIHKGLATMVQNGFNEWLPHKNKCFVMKIEPGDVYGSFEKYQKTIKDIFNIV